jgi:hypothetical protein
MLVKNDTVANDPQQHQREAKDRKCHVPRSAKRSPDSESVQNLQQKTSIDVKRGPQKFDFTSNSGGHHGGGTNVHPGPAKPDSVCYRSTVENPLSQALLGEPRCGATVQRRGTALRHSTAA